MLVTTAGFEDVFFIGRQARPLLYALKQSNPPPVITSDMIAGIRERINFKGEVVVPLSEKGVSEICDLCMKKRPESIAVCLLHSYANPSHERALLKALKSLGVTVSISSEVMPEFREYERTSTTVINAYLGPVAGNYIKRLEKQLPETTILIQQSNGGCVPASKVEEYAVQTLLSGPAAGVQAALELGKRLGFPDIITFDMGGTSTDVSLCPGELTYTRDYTIEGFPVSIPFIDIHTVGAGGGSIAWIDRGGFLAVGPESAGADPGPVCYGKGNRVTVTDADLFLGRLLPDTFLAGRMKLYPERAQKAMEDLAARLGMNATDTALGIIKLVNNNMTQAIRAVSVEKGHDPREFALVCFGGAAGMHALEVADELDIRNVIIPHAAGIFSALGMSGADVAIEKSRAFLKNMGGKAEEAELMRSFDDLESQTIYEIRSSGISQKDIEFKRNIDVRYRGQSFEITVPWSDKWQENMHAAHERLYGYSMPDAGLEITAIRIRALIKQDDRPFTFSSCYSGEGKKNKAERSGLTEMILSNGPISVPVIQRKDLVQGEILAGPLLITDDFTTVTVHKNWDLELRENNIICRKST